MGHTLPTTCRQQTVIVQDISFLALKGVATMTIAIISSFTTTYGKAATAAASASGVSICASTIASTFLLVLRLLCKILHDPKCLRPWDL